MEEDIGRPIKGYSLERAPQSLASSWLMKHGGKIIPEKMHGLEKNILIMA